MLKLSKITHQGNDGQHVDVAIYYREKKNKSGQVFLQVLDEKKAKESIEKGDTTISVLNTTWMIQTWKMRNHIIESSEVYNNITGRNNIDPQKYQDNILKNCLLAWDITDDNGNPIPVSPGVIDILPEYLPGILLSKYEACLDVEEENQKK